MLKTKLTLQPFTALCKLALTNGMRPVFGEDRQNPNAKKEDCLDWGWHQIGEPVTRVIQTGIEFGSPRADLTKFINWIEGRSVSPTEFEADPAKLGELLESYDERAFNVTFNPRFNKNNERYDEVTNIVPAQGPITSRNSSTATSTKSE